MALRSLVDWLVAHGWRRQRPGAARRQRLAVQIPTVFRTATRLESINFLASGPLCVLVHPCCVLVHGMRVGVGACPSAHCIAAPANQRARLPLSQQLLSRIWMDHHPYWHEFTAMAGPAGH